VPVITGLQVKPSVKNAIAKLRIETLKLYNKE